MNSILAGKKVCVVCDWDSKKSSIVEQILVALRAAHADSYLMDSDIPMMQRSRQDGLLHNLNQADAFVVCSDANLMARRNGGGDMTAIINTMESSGKYIYELPMSRFRGDMDPQFGGVLLSHLITGTGDMSTKIFNVLGNIINDINTRGGFSTQIAMAVGAGSDTLQGRLAANMATKKHQDAVRDAVANARIAAIVERVQACVNRGDVETLAYRGIVIPASEGIDPWGGTKQALVDQLQQRFGPVTIDYSTGFSQDRHNDRPMSHTLKVTGGRIDSMIKMLRSLRSQEIIDNITTLINSINIGVVDSYMIPSELELDDAAQKICIDRLNQLGIGARYDDNIQRGDRGYDRPRPHYLRFNKVDIQAKLAEALAKKLVDKITSSGNNVGPRKFANKDINGNNDQFPIEIIQGAKKQIGNSIKIDQKQEFYVPKDRYLEISR